MIRLWSLLLLSILCVPVVAQVLTPADTGRIFNTVDIFLEPRDGMENFKIRWLHYLKEAKGEGRLDKAIHADHIFEVLVEKDGILLDRRSGSKDPVLLDFLRIQKRWSPGIQSGRPICYLLKLKVPKELFGKVAIEELIVRKDLVKQEHLKE